MLGELLLQHGDGRYEEEVCPECGQKTKSNGRRTRTVIHAEGKVKVKRHRLCPDCGQGIFPPGPTTSTDRATWSPGTIAQALRLGSEIPFARAAKQFNELTAAATAAAGEGVGGRWLHRSAGQSEVMNISMDGAMDSQRRPLVDLPLLGWAHNSGQIGMASTISACQCWMHRAHVMQQFDSCRKLMAYFDRNQSRRPRGSDQKQPVRWKAALYLPL